MRLKKKILKIIILLCAPILILFFLEIATRIVFPQVRPRISVKKESPRNIEKKISFSQPLFEGTLTTSEYTMQIKTNSDGFRGGEHALVKPEGVYRILVVGDSFTFGWGVEAEQAYPALLQKLLNERKSAEGLKYEVFNLGLPSIGTLQELEIIKYGINYRPDLILLGLLAEDRWNLSDGNDLCDNYKHKKFSLGKPVTISPSSLSARTKGQIIIYLNQLHRFLARNSQLYYLVMKQQGSFMRKNLIRLRTGQNRNFLDAGWRITEEAVKEADTLTQKAGARFVLLRIPFLFDAYNDHDDRASQILEKFSRNNSILFLDLLTVLRENKDQDLYYPADGHMKAKSHALMAGGILDFLLKHNIISPN